MLKYCFHGDFIKSTCSVLRTLSDQSSLRGHVEKHRDVDQMRQKVEENICSRDVQRLEQMLQAEREERGRLELEVERLRREKERLEEHGGQESGKRFYSL